MIAASGIKKSRPARVNYLIPYHKGIPHHYHYFHYFNSLLTVLFFILNRKLKRAVERR